MTTNLQKTRRVSFDLELNVIHVLPTDVQVKELANKIRREAYQNRILVQDLLDDSIVSEIVAACHCSSKLGAATGASRLKSSLKQRPFVLPRRAHPTKNDDWQIESLPYTPIHTPVMLPQVLTHLSPTPGGIYGDLTFGDGGYTKAILDTCDCQVVAVDQDPAAYEKALQMASMSAYKGRLFPILGRFGDLASLVKTHLPWKLPCFDGMVMDIGVSSGQVETASRGFSYKLDGPLDMRMFSRGRFMDSEATSPEEQALLRKSISAYEIVNFYSREQIANIIYQYGGDRLSRKIAAAIVDARQVEPIETTGTLAAVIQKACPQPRWKRGDDDMLRNSAARTFQALRIYINNELGELENALRSSEYLLKPQGTLVAVTFHSLEDRMVKNYMHHCAGKRSMDDAEHNQFDMKRQVHREWKKQVRRISDEHEHTLAFNDRKGKHTTTHSETLDPSFRLTSKKVILPTRDETAVNPRSRSAKLRAAQRTTAIPLAPLGPLETVD